MKLRINKKGEMTTEQIVIMIIAIASFAVIMYFLGSLAIGDNTEDELCRNSVVQRETVGKTGVSADTIPLKCKKSYVCLTKSGDCEKMYKPEIKKVKTESEVYEALAEELANCWWMFGEGRVNYAGSDALPNLYCSFCNQIAFDDSIKEIFPSGEFSENKLYEELTKLNKSEGVSYFKYLFGTSDSTEFLKQDFGNIKIDSQYYSLMAITGDVSTVGWAIAGAVAATVIIGTGGTAIIAGAVIGAGAAELSDYVGGKTIAISIKGKSGNDFIPPTLVEVNSDELTVLGCEQVTTSS